MRFTLYAHNVESFRPPLEIVVETDLIKQLLAEGELTPAEIVETVSRGVGYIEQLLLKFVAEKKPDESIPGA